MPVYEYFCGSCELGFERYVQRFGDEVRCPSCEGPVERQLSSFACGSSPGFAPQAAAGACCGGGCGCRHGR